MAQAVVLARLGSWRRYFRISMNKPSSPEDNVFGISPLGGNSVEGTGPGMAEIRDTSVQGVPLFWDSRVNAYISEQAVDELNDRDIGECAREDHRREESFYNKIGITRG